MAETTPQSNSLAGEYGCSPGRRPDWASKDDSWFAWRPVRVGALGTGPVRWLVRLWRNKCCGVTIYQDLGDVVFQAADIAAPHYLSFHALNEWLIAFRRRSSGVILRSVTMPPGVWAVLFDRRPWAARPVETDFSSGPHGERQFRYLGVWLREPLSETEDWLFDRKRAHG